MNCCLQKHTTHQYTYFIYYSCQNKFKYSRIIKKHQVYQKLLAKQYLKFCLTCFLFVIHLNLKQIRSTGEPMTQYTDETCGNVNHVRT